MVASMFNAVGEFTTTHPIGAALLTVLVGGIIGAAIATRSNRRG